MRQWLIATTVGLGLVRIAAAQLETNETPHPVVATMIGDAVLTDVCFVSRTCGWSVGERGVIWHTRDGGVTWQLQKSGVSCRLNSVCFLDERIGWAVGGAHQPYSSATRGVVLRTVDGGETWTVIPGLMLPKLARVQFFNANDGVATGWGSSFFPSGVYASHDGGRGWQPLPADRTGHWLAADFLDAESGAMAGSGGRFANLAQRQVIHSPLAAESSRSFHAMRLVAPTGGWLVGDAGMVMTTRDLGRSWQTCPGDIPAAVFNQFDFHALAVRGRHVWIGGSPGTRIFHSADGGASWQAQSTGQAVPLRALWFVDESNGWAVGELGTILATNDGGQTWHRQKSGGQRAALLAVVADVNDVPLEVFANEGAAEGYLSAVEILHHQNTDDAAAADSADREREALVQAGATSGHTAWQFSLPPNDLALKAEDLIAALNRENDGQALEKLERHLITQLRMWRPDVVITNHAGAASSRPAAELVELLLLRAIDSAADPNQAAHVSSATGLPPWQVKRVYGVVPRGIRGHEAVSTSRFLTRLGGTVEDWSRPAYQLLGRAAIETPDSIELQMLVNRIPDEDAARGLFHGIRLSPGGDARRPGVGEIVGDVDDLRRMALKRRSLGELLQRNEGNAAWIAQVESMVDGLDAGGGGDLLFQLADGYRERGRLDLAADTFFLLTRRYPNHALTDPALVWLLQYYSSSEALRRASSGSAIDARAVDAESSSEADEGVKPASAVVPISPRAAPAVGLSRDDRLRRAVQLGEYLETARPLLYAEPAIRFPLIAAQRQLGYANPAKRYFLTLGQLPESNPWRRCADTEKWFSDPDELPPPKVLGHCRRAAERPHLDGRLDEPFWRSADRLVLRSGELPAPDYRRDSAVATAAEPRPPAVRLAYDAEYLYLAVECPRAAGNDYQTDTSPRPRDAELREHDRVSLRLDVDRDFATWFELTVDHRGWTHDAAWSDAEWNPSWYVAAGGDASTWSAEAAIPLAELAAQSPTTKDVWAVSIRRTIPRAGYQSWSGDGRDESPDAFGCLIFE